MMIIALFFLCFKYKQVILNENCSFIILTQKLKIIDSFYIFIAILYCYLMTEADSPVGNLIYQRLLPQQQEIVDYFTKNGSQSMVKLVLTLAYPGTGKTFTIFELLVELTKPNIINSLSYNNFLFLTFNKNNIVDMKNKITQRIDDQTIRNTIIGRVKNYNSLALQFLNKFTLLTEYHMQVIKEEIFEEEGLSKQQQINLISIIQRLQIEGAYYDEYELKVIELAQNQSPLVPSLKRYIAKLKQLEKDKLYSFNHSICAATNKIKLKQLDEACINFSANQLLIIDEVQDVNPAQLKLITAILQTNPEMKLLMMGDIDQNIYNWRGSCLKAIDEFITTFEKQQQLKTHRLIQDHRLTSECQDLAHAVINSFTPYSLFRNQPKYYNGNRPCSITGQSFQPQITKYVSQISEAVSTIELIQNLHREEGIPYSRMTILLERIHRCSFYTKLKKQLTRKDIQYQIHYQKDVYQKPIVKLLLSYIAYFFKKQRNRNESIYGQLKRMKQRQKILHQDEIFRQFIHKREISENVIKRIKNQKKYKKNQSKWNNWYKITFVQIKRIIQKAGNQSFQDICQRILKIIQITQTEREDIDQFYSIIEDVRLLTENQHRNTLLETPLMKMMAFLIQKNHYKIQVQRVQSKSPKINTLFNYGYSNMLTRLMKRNSSVEEKQQTNRQRLGIISEGSVDECQNLKESDDKLVIQTICTSKGMTYEAVFLCSLNYLYKQNSIPNYLNRVDTTPIHPNNVRTIIDRSCSQRLIYTAVTRSKKYLYVSSSKEDRFGSLQTKTNHPLYDVIKNHLNNQLTVPYDEQHDQELKQRLDKHQRN